MKVDFFIVGAPKAGTTSLYHYLNEHPQIEMSLQKEPDYFSDAAIQKQGIYYGKNRIDTEEKYNTLFNTQKKDVIFGEGSVSYLFYPNVAQDIKAYNPIAKIIIMLRNPIDRAFSHYLMDYRLGLVSDSFEDIINKKSKHKNAHLFYQQYIKVGEYATQLKRYFDVFDKENILLIDYEDFKSDVVGTVDLVYSFLNVSAEFVADLNKKHNTFTMPKNKLIRFMYSFVVIRNILSFIFPKSMVKAVRLILFRKNKKPKLLEETSNQLKHYFSNDVRLLESIIGKDYSKWIK
ncbi:MAG TPA: sulfotransferase [Flavobacteriales bacterium]|nr:sulfotransferase [Flavobacteriales bacterium]HIK63068.1 sulfotransferase [Flavobacteriales bacterium]